jgi:hypothetical protein
MPQIVAQVQQRGRSGKQWAKAWDEELVKLLSRILSGKELAEFSAWRLVPTLEPRSMLGILDEVILRQAETGGWRSALSTIVQRRFSDWDIEKDGPKLFSRLGNAYAKAARIMQGRELPPLDDPQLYLSKLKTVRELSRIQKKMLAESMPQAAPELRNFFFAAIVGGKRSFVALNRNLERWKAFCEQKENLPLLLSFAKRDGDRQVTPVQLFDAWMAWCKGAARGKPMDQETVRKRISAMGRYC